MILLKIKSLKNGISFKLTETASASISTPLSISDLASVPNFISFPKAAVYKAVRDTNLF